MVRPRFALISPISLSFSPPDATEAGELALFSLTHFWLLLGHSLSTFKPLMVSHQLKNLIS